MSQKNETGRIDLYVDGVLVYSRQTSRSYAWAIVGVATDLRSRLSVKKWRILNCFNDLGNATRELEKRQRGRCPDAKLCPIIDGRVTTMTPTEPAAG